MQKNKTILIIDDSSTNVVLLDSLLEANGYRTLTAFCVKDALVLLEREIPDLILLDLLMPMIDGFEFLNIIKEDSRCNTIPIIVVSAVLDSDTINKAEDYGIIDYICKPVNLKTFIKTVEKVFEE